jgi:hypothetical protein
MTKGITWAPAPVEHLACWRLWLGFELRTPIAERLEWNPVSLAILTPIELTLNPSLVVRPAKSLAYRSRTDDISFST